MSYDSTLARAQRAYDNMLPPEDDDAMREQYVADLVDEMMRTGECDLVPFFTKTSGLAVDGFDVAGSEALADADTRDCELLQLVLACLNGEHDKAERLAKYFEDKLREVAGKLIEDALELREDQGDDRDPE